MNDILAAARQLHALGANVTAIQRGSKRVLHKWRQLQNRRQSREELESYSCHMAAGVGIINGPSGYRTFDTDGAPDDAPLRVLLEMLGLPEDYAWVWRSGSGEGWGVAFRCDEELPDGVLPAKKQESGVFWGWPAHKNGLPFHHVELRWEHSQTICPPSGYTYNKKDDPRRGQAGPGYHWHGAAPTDAPAEISITRVINAFFTLAPPPPQTLGSLDEATKAALRARFDMVAYAQRAFGCEIQHEGAEVRILGQGGLLIKPEESIWYNHRDQIGGDCFDLVAYAKYRTLVRNLNGKSSEILGEAAAFVGMVLPARTGSPAMTSNTGVPPGGVPLSDDSIDPDDPRPRIDVGDLDIPQISRRAWDAVAAASSRLFRRGGGLVRLERSDAGTLVLVSIERRRMAGILARACIFQRTTVSRGGEGVTIVEPPGPIVDDMLVNIDNQVPIISRIVRAPIIGSDGALIDRPGYHAGSRVYYDPRAGLVIPAVPAMPGRDDLSRACSLILDELLGEFPFADDADRAHAVALLLLPFARDLIDGPTPLHLIEAPTMGSGKGLLADVLLLPALGEALTPLTEAGDDDEWRKRITSALLDGPPAIYLDNLNRSLASGALASALTTSEWSDRVLGRSELARMPVRCVWVATANNPTLSGEIARRCIRIRIDPKVDRPWERAGFRHSQLRAWALENRGELIWSALVLIRAGLQNGLPTRSLGSFEGWSDVIGRILGGVGIPGFLGNLDKLYDRADVEGAAWRSFVSAWWEAHGGADVTAGELYRLLEQSEIDLPVRGKTDRALRTCFGMLLGRMEDRVLTIAEGALRLRITGAGTRQGAKIYQLVPLSHSREPGEPREPF